MSIKTNVKILPVLAPENSGASGGPLEYGPENIASYVKNRLQEPQVWDNFMESAPGSLEEKKSARELSEIFLGASAIHIMNGVKDPTTLSKQAEWLTQQSIDIYGTQNPQDTSDVMSNDLSLFESLRSSEKVDQFELGNLIKVYRELGIEPVADLLNVNENESSLDKAGIAFKDFLESQYGFILESFDGTTLYTAQDLISICSSILFKLSEIDSRWSGWSVEAKKDGSMSVVSKEKKIKIGLLRAPSLGTEAGASVLHEVADHALRSVNGEETGDDDLQYGLTGYIDFEEGLGCYMEYVLTGRVPSKISNRQITASLALGQLGKGKKHDRNEIFDILALRTKIILQSEGAENNQLFEAKIKELRTLVIDRFFRGGRGVEPAISVYTKDIVYAEGFSKAKKYVTEQINDGVNPAKLFKFLLSAKFDPTIPEHIERLKNKQIELDAN